VLRAGTERAVFIAILAMAGVCNSQEYHFASIEKLTEQKIGKIIISEVYNSLNIHVEITPLPGIRAQVEAASGNKDGEIMRIWTYGLETPTTIRVPTPYYYLETMAFIKVNSGIKIKNKDDLRKYSLVKVRGVKHTNNITAGMPDVYTIGSTEQMMEFLNDGRADIALTNTVDGLMALNKLGFTEIVPLDEPLAVLDLYHYIHSDHLKLVKKVDAAIKRMKGNGQLKQLIKQAEKQVYENESPDL